MRSLFAFVALSCVALALAGWCPNGGFCNGVCCKSFFHWRCCPAYDGVCCQGGWQCCAGGRMCLKINGTNFCVGRAAGLDAGSQPMSLDAETSFSTERLSPEDPEVEGDQMKGFEVDV